MSGGHEIEPATVSLAPLDDMGVNRAMAELAEWCARHFHLIEQGRKVGVRLGASAAVKDAIVNTAGSVGSWFADKLGINSPSRVFAGFGINTIEGLVQGLQAEKDGPLAALSGIVQRMRQVSAGIVLGAAALPAAAFDTRPPIQAGSPAAAAAASSSITVNVYGTPGMDTQTLARAVRSEIEAFDRERAARSRSRFGDNN